MFKSCLDNLKKKNWYLYIIIAIFVLGIALRLAVYLYNRPLWFDEAQISINILKRSFGGFFSALEYYQAAPPLFMSSVKLFSMIFGIKEFALRMFPFICALVAIPVFYKFSKVFLIRKWSIILASLLFALNRELIYYSQEVKQYSSDVLFFMLSFLVLNKLSLKNLSITKTILYSLGISLFPMFSIPTCFVIGGWFIREIISNRFKNIKNLIVFTIPIAVVNLLYYIFVIKPQHSSQIKLYEDFWNQGFLNFNPVYDFSILKSNMSFFFSPTTFFILKAILLLIGLYYVFRRTKSLRNILLISFFVLMFAFSFAHIYPIYQRVALYTVPLLIVFIIKPFDYLSVKNKLYSLIISVMFLCAFWGYNPSYIIHFDKYFNPAKMHSHTYNPKMLMKKLKQNYKGDAWVVVSRASYPEYYYYSRYYKFMPKHLKMTYPWKGNYLEQLNDLKDGEYWFYYSFDFVPTPVIPIAKKWASDYEILYEYETEDMYLFHMYKNH